jgi:hypothetical protein
MNPNARRSVDNFDCLPEDSGVDLNRNWKEDWGVSEAIQVGLSKEHTYDSCADPCGECYRGKEPFSEPESRALRDFLIAHKKEIKFVSNFHSYGNMWIYPFNGKEKNPIADTNPEAFLVFQEIVQMADFPSDAKNDGNSYELMGERIGGDMDDWVLKNLNIPSVTSELGKITQYADTWQVLSKQDALQICEQNTPWLEHVF